MTNHTLLYRHSCTQSALGGKQKAPRYDDEYAEEDTDYEDYVPQPPPPPPLQRQEHHYPQYSYRQTLLQQQEQQRQARLARMIAPMRNHYRIIR